MKGRWDMRRLALALAMLCGLLGAAPAQAQVAYAWNVAPCGCLWGPPVFYAPAAPLWYFSAPAPITPPKATAPATKRTMPSASEKPSTTPAPSSLVQDVETPKRAPVITESRFEGSATSEARAGRCRVGFWNLTGRAVSLTVDGERRTLAKDRALTLELPSRFVWQVDEGDARTERLAPAQSTHEIVIRD